MLVEFFESIRKKPARVRTRIGIIALAITMILILNVWVLNLRHLLARYDESEEDATLQAAIQEEVVEITRDTPSLVASVKSGFGQLVSQLKEISAQENSESIVPEADDETEAVETGEPEQVRIEPTTKTEPQEEQDETFDSFLDIYDEYYQ